jgi:hypothetical protein
MTAAISMDGGCAEWQDRCRRWGRINRRLLND